MADVTETDGEPRPDYSQEATPRPLPAAERLAAWAGRVVIAVRYRWIAAAVLAINLGYVINGRRSGDVYLHAAAVSRLAENAWNPRNPMVASHDPDVGFSPYALLLGTVARLTGTSAFRVIDAAGIALVVILLCSLPSAVRALTRGAADPRLVLLFTMVLWGILPWRYSGYLHLNAMGYMVGYPSMAAWCALLLVVIMAQCMATTNHWKWAVGVGLGMAFISLVHPITLIGATPLVIGIWLRDLDSVSVVKAGSAAAIAALATLAWPYYFVLDLLRDGEVYDHANSATYSHVFAHAFLTIPGFVVLCLSLTSWKRLPDPLVLCTAFSGCIFIVGAPPTEVRWGGRCPSQSLPPILRWLFG